MVPVLPMLRLIAAVLLLVPLASGASGLRDKELRITVPRWSRLTPVQQLNRDGVEAARKHQVEKAQALFFKAYLYDPTDPFTLNNLGYAAELAGDAQRANELYALAEKQDCDATIELSSLDKLKGKPMLYALQDLNDAPLRLNRLNVQAIELLAENRGFEAARLLERALTLDPGNPFTLNNLGVADELTGDLEGALESYGRAAASPNAAVVIVSPQKSWRGKPVRELAAASRKRVEARLNEEGPAKARAAMLALRGVTAVNGNDWGAAKQDFLQAAEFDPASAFALNNLGFIAEKNGDLETADFFYRKARRAEDAGAAVGAATQPAAHGRPLAAVAAAGDAEVDKKLDSLSRARHTEEAPELIPRGPGADPAAEAPPDTVPKPEPAAPPQP